MSRGNNRNVEEVPLKDPDRNSKSSELVNHKTMEREIAMKTEPSPAKNEDVMDH